MKFLYRTWAEIDLDALDFNLEQIRACCPEKQAMGVVKANAYGHDAGICSKEYYRLGVRFFAVSNIWEAERVKEALPYSDIDIIVFGYIPEEFFDDAISMGITFTIGSVDYAKELSTYGKAHGVTFKGHLKLDTGMTRVGIRTREEINGILALPCLEITGAYSHFAVADRLEHEHWDYTLKQEKKLRELTDGLNVPIHCQNSGGIIFHPDFIGDYTRPGLILYGLSPNTDLEKPPIKLKQVMTLKSRVNQLKEVPAGINIGYGRTYTTDSKRLIALIPAGYADGISRRMSNKGFMAVNGVLCPIRGRVCMDQIMLDVTDVPDVKVGDEVLIYSDRFRETSLDYIADLTETISNELICAVSARVPRVAVRNGEAVEFVRER